MHNDRDRMDAVARYFDALAPEWAQRLPEAPEAAASLLAVARLAGVRAGSRVLDLGCGTGVMVPAYEALGAGRVLGVDASSGMVKAARERLASQAGNPICADVSFAACDALALETGERFDVAVIYNAYPHFPDPAALVKKAASLLNPGGRFLVAHGMGRVALNAHHANVPKDITRDLLPAETEAAVWRTRFRIDVLADTPHFYAFGGALL